MLKTLLLLLLPVMLAGPFTTPRKQIPELEALKTAVIKDILSAEFDKQILLERIAQMKPDGSWPDIDYADKTRGGWLVNTHLTRLNDMAIMHAREQADHHDDTALRAKIILGLDFWLKNDFICPNWWYPEIGVPKVLGPTMILMEKYLSPKQIAEGVKILNRSKIGMTGQNRVWLSGNVIYRSLITQDLPLIRSAVAAIQNEITVSQGEGIQPDNSFHQHGPQQQFGNYGLSFAVDMLKWGKIFQPTTFRFSQDKVAMIRNYLLDGMKWVIWNNKMDISACGRQLFPNAQTGKAGSIADVYAKMPFIDPASGALYNTALNSFNGNKHFWRSDMTVHRRKNFYASVKMSSSRVAGAESCNEENISGYHLGDGATYYYQSNQEYTDIFPFWDWKMLPGTTAFHDNLPLPVLSCNGYRIPSDFVGGLSDGNNGIATLAYRRDSLSAQKSWFFFNDAIICLGAGINSDQLKPVYTTINQSFLRTPVKGKINGTVKTFDNGLRKIDNTRWIIQDNWGYYFPRTTSVCMSNKLQDGDWHNVLKRMPSQLVQNPVFTLWIDHGSAPSNSNYVYIVFPHAKEAEIDGRGQAVTILANNDSLQVVEIARQAVAGFVFVRPGQASTTISGKISVSKPCVVMYAKSTITVADPTHNFTNLTLTLPGKRKSPELTARYSPELNSTAFDIILPREGLAGKPVTFSIN
jgi:chondroitin AC lyase